MSTCSKERVHFLEAAVPRRAAPLRWPRMDDPLELCMFRICTSGSVNPEGRKEDEDAGRRDERNQCLLVQV